MPGFDPGSLHMGPAVDEVAMGQVFLRILQFCPVGIILPMLHIHLHVALTRRTNAPSLWTFGIREHCGEKYFFFAFIAGTVTSPELTIRHNSA
jgi:hypothetical protein